VGKPYFANVLRDRRGLLVREQHVRLPDLSASIDVLITPAAARAENTEAHSDARGGALFLRAGSVALHGSMFTGNQAQGDGGAVFASTAVRFEATECTFEGLLADPRAKQYSLNC